MNHYYDLFEAVFEMIEEDYGWINDEGVRGIGIGCGPAPDILSLTVFVDKTNWRNSEYGDLSITYFDKPYLILVKIEKTR